MDSVLPGLGLCPDLIPPFPLLLVLLVSAFCLTEVG